MSRASAPDPEVGPVLVTSGRHRGRIGYLDDDDDAPGGKVGIVSFGRPYIAKRSFVRMSSLRVPTTPELLQRQEKLTMGLSAFSARSRRGAVRVSALEELALVEGILIERLELAQSQVKRGKSVFLCHSSVDKPFVRALATDLGISGHAAWLDEWQISVGESIVRRAELGVDESDYVAVVLSPAAVASGWVRSEWETKLWDEIRTGQVRVLPVLWKDCEIPALLRGKRYADFRTDYIDGLRALVAALSK